MTDKVTIRELRSRMYHLVQLFKARRMVYKKNYFSLSLEKFTSGGVGPKMMISS